MAERDRLASEDVVIQAPMSFTGSARRVWKMTRSDNATLKWLLLVPAALVVVGAVWAVVLCWYVVFGIVMFPYRLLRRGSRKRKRDELRHRELLHRT